MMDRRSLLGAGLTVVVGGVAGYAVTRGTGVAKSQARVPTVGYGPSPLRSGSSNRGVFLTSVADVPAGGGVVVGAKLVVVTRTEAGAVHGFSAICTHQQCQVNQVANGTIDCPCHGSRFNAFTGAVVAGPAPHPLPAVPVVVRGGNVYTT